MKYQPTIPNGSIPQATPPISPAFVSPPPMASPPRHIPTPKHTPPNSTRVKAFYNPRINRAIEGYQTYDLSSVHFQFEDQFGPAFSPLFSASDFHEPSNPFLVS
eukprot:Phypoly_transcript_26082.p1 GENE.Phypoly_transcript_26082~~Phypoly_transcript_26082.p1  ORF type:complete len:104 (+),score=21.56 Phypoly_transcript_26082:25-336(+)